MFRKVVPLVVAPILLASACANEAEPGALEVTTADAAVSALRGAPDAAAAAGTSQFEMTIEGTAPVGSAAGQAFEMTATGAVDADAGQMSMTMDLADLFEQLATATGQTLPEGVGGALEFRADGDTFYLRVPMVQMFTGTTDWLSMTSTDLGTTAQGLGLGAGTYDPSAILESLRGVADEPEVVGHEEVRGVETTHYRSDLDLSRALEAAPEAQRERIAASLDQLGDLEGATIPVDIWLDDDDLVRRMTVDLGNTFGAVSGQDASITLTVEFFGFGDTVDIDIPSEDEVTPFREVAGDLGMGGMGS